MVSDTEPIPGPNASPKLSEHVVAALRAQVLGGEIRAGPETADRGPTDRDLRRSAAPSSARRSPRSPPMGSSRRARAPASSSWSIRHGAFAAISQEIGNKISHALNVLEVRMGIEIESAGLAAIRRNSAQEAAIQEAFFEFERLLAIGQATGKTDFAFHRAIAAATNNPFYVEVLDALGAAPSPAT